MPCPPLSLRALLISVIVSIAQVFAAVAADPLAELQILDESGAVVGACPLKHTDVRADIAGYIARVTVEQTYQNPTDRKIEAVYVFPLPEDAAVDHMVMTIGDRRIVGQIKEREEAREIYDAAIAAGHVAALLDQERANIFTQRVGNIEPGVEIGIEIRYVETVPYEDGVFEWVFPMVVGPRYIPGGGSAPAPMTKGQDTEQVPDASKITPPVVPPGTRSGHDIGLMVSIQSDADLPVRVLESELHEITLDQTRSDICTVRLAQADEIPNRDFILRYALGDGKGIGDAFLVHEDKRGRFFTLVLLPPERVVPRELVARELIFVVDTSGSMHGYPIEKSRAVVSKLIDTMRPEDTFNVILFSGRTSVLWKTPRPATNENIAAAQKLIAEQQGAGGTEMMQAIEAALAPSPDADTQAGRRIRVVCFFTDGFVGNDMEIIGAVQKYADTTRVFSFGIGNGVNRFLLDGMAHAGRGAVEYVTLEGQADKAVERFHERILAPVLTDITIDWGSLPVQDVVPQRIPDLFSAQPIRVHGRLTGEASGTIVLHGWTGGGKYEESITVDWPATPPDHVALASLWARAKVEDLLMEDYGAVQRNEFPEELRTQIIGLGLDFNLMTQFTSFVAVERLVVTSGGEPVTVDVPVEMTSGVSYEGVFGEPLAAGAFFARGALRGPPGGGRGFGVPRSAQWAATPSKPPPPAAAEPLAEEDDYDTADDGRVELTAEMIEAKLAEPLRGLAARVEKEGTDGDLTVGRMSVEDYRVDVMLVLTGNVEKIKDKLAELGFKLSSETSNPRVVIGSADVRKLEDLARLSEVLRIKPLKSP